MGRAQRGWAAGKPAAAAGRAAVGEFVAWLARVGGFAARLGPAGGFAAGLVLAVGLALAARAGSEAEAPADCRLCAAHQSAPIVKLTAARLDSLAQADAFFNQERIGRIDSLWRAGAFGPPESGEAQRAAHLLARVSTVNSYRYLARFAADPDRVYEADESTWVDVARNYSDISLVSIARLRRLRMGLGHVCAHYDLDEPVRGETILGGKTMRFRVADAELFGTKRRVLELDLPSGSSDLVKVMLAEHYSFAFETKRSDGPPAPYEWYVVRDIEGGWLRKWGTHRPRAFMFWSSPLERGEPSMPRQPMVGVRIYVPHLKLKLPFILPDINFDDLREIDLPQPILAMEWLREGRQPSWLRTNGLLAFEDWKGNGAVPQHVRRAFPDD
jgi:hypothetical protein